jgi:hypothetical protein
MKTRIVSAALAGTLSVLATAVSAQVTVSTPVSSGLTEPCDVVVDATNNFFVADSANNRIVRFDHTTAAASTLAGIASDPPGSNDGPPEQAHFNNPQKLLTVNFRGVDGLLVADSGNNLIRFVCFSNGMVTTLAGQTNAGAVDAAGTNATFRTPVGLAQDTNGNVYIADWGNNAIRVMNLNDLGITNVTITPTNLYRPTAVACAGANQLWVADTGNQQVKLITLTNSASGSLTACLGGYRLKGTADSYLGTNARFDTPSGLIWVSDVGLLISDTLNNSIRLATNYPGYGYGVTNYAVTTFAATSGEGDGGLQDGSATAAKFNSPFGLVKEIGNSAFLVADLKNNAIRRIQDGPPRPLTPTILTVLTNYGEVTLAWSASQGASSYNVKRSPADGGPYTTIANVTVTNYTDLTVINGRTYFYVVSALGPGGESANSGQVSATPPLPPVPDPEIGYVAYPPLEFVSVFHPFSSFIAYNDVDLVIKGTPGSSTWYTYGYTANTSEVTNPSPASASIPSDYTDGLAPNQVVPYTVYQVAPYLTFKAIGTKSDGSPDSAIVTATIQFVTGNPNINGNNAAQFTISDITANAHLYYTLDGTDPSPTNGVDLGTVPTPIDIWTVGFPIFTNTWFKVRAFHANYQPSAIVSNYFSPTNMTANTIEFGFESGEASSHFVGSAGQYFYAPVTLTPLPNSPIYSLQFNVTVTNAGPVPGPAVATGAYSFQSFLEKPIPGTQPPVFERIPPLMFAEYASEPPPLSATVFLDGMPFVNLMFADTKLNLLGVGWVERFGMTNLYDTTKQTLITYSQAHDTMFSPSIGKVVLGGYAFQIPPIAVAGQTYQIQIARPSATSDGIGAPSGSVYIATPTNGSLAAGPINSIKLVTVGQLKYLAGDSAPFRWFNAGDFGNTNLDNSDVEQVFQSAIYSLNYPPTNSDLFDSMDSCGGTYMDLGHGYLEFNSYISGPAALNPLFDGDDASINQIAFGDGSLDVCDVYVTFRRSLDPSLNWFRRFWTNGVRGAETVFPQPKSLTVLKTGGAAQAKNASTSLTNLPLINFATTDFVASAGQTLQVPITAHIFGDYPVRILMLNLSVVPLDGSPALSSGIKFIPNAALGTPSLTSSTGNGNFAAAWLNSAVAGLSGNATLGTLTVTLPANASSSAAYAIHFDHISASPNGLAVLPKQTFTGLITLATRDTSSYGDGIPDSWRLRWFGTIYNALSAASADACGDGINNWEKYLAGTDPTDLKAYPRLSSRNPAPAGATAAIHWPSVSGRKYVIESSASLFPGSWTALTTNTGTGAEMEFDDSTSAGARFYRVRILP